MALSTKKEQRHAEIKFELQDLAARALIPSEVRDEPQIHPGRCADVEETEGMSTPTEGRGDILIRNISGNIKLIAFWTCVSRILMHHPTFKRKQSFFPRGAKRRRNTSKFVWTNAVTSLPLWFLVMELLETT